jgi:ABC-type nitrate/sulfonate/bicarbonate transport system permease component
MPLLRKSQPVGLRLATGATADTAVRARLAAPQWSHGALAVLGTMLAFELATRLELLPSRYLPPVSVMLSALADRLGQPAFWEAVGQTMQGWAIGLAIAFAVAVPVGIVVGSSGLAYRALRPLIEFLRPIPSVALIPLAVLVWGTGMESKVYLIVFAAFWPLLIQTLYGVQDVDPVAIDTGRMFGLGRVQRLVRIKLPSALAYVATGLRISSATALILAVTCELVMGAPGLGRTINVARSAGSLDVVYALVIVTGVLGLIVNMAFGRIEKRLLRWHPSQRLDTEGC